MRTEKCMLAKAGDEKKIEQMIASGNYSFERKYDGERGIIQVTNMGNAPSEGIGWNVAIYNRSGKDISSQFPELKEMAENLPYGTYDGEIFVESNAQNKDKPTTAGRTGVNASDAKLLGKVKPAHFRCFDVLEFEGEIDGGMYALWNVESKPYEYRKAILARADFQNIKLFKVVFPEKDPLAVWNTIKANGDEGLVAKLKGSTYQHCRSSNWVKLKTGR